MRPNTYNPDCDFDPDQRDLDASIEERNKTEPDATARAYENSALYEFELYLHENGQALRIPDAIPGSVMVAAEKFAEQYADKQIQIQTPRIKADAVREFIAEVEKEANRLMDASKSRYGLQSQISDHYPSAIRCLTWLAIQQVNARRSGEEGK